MRVRVCVGGGEEAGGRRAGWLVGGGGGHTGGGSCSFVRGNCRGGGEGGRGVGCVRAVLVEGGNGAVCLATGVGVGKVGKGCCCGLVRLY